MTSPFVLIVLFHSKLQSAHSLPNKPRDQVTEQIHSKWSERIKIHISPLSLCDFLQMKMIPGRVTS